MIFDASFFVRIFLLVVILAVLFAAMMPLWDLALHKLRKWWRIRNLRLCDYPNLYEVAGLIKPSFDGLINSELMYSVERRSWKLERFGERGLIVSRLSRQLEESINRRYYQKGMRNAYKRASKVFLHYPQQRTYYQFDEESDDFYQQALKVQEHRCLRCEDSGEVWGSPVSGIQTTISCECQPGRQNICD